jgi:hypothetical protein
MQRDRIIDHGRDRLLGQATLHLVAALRREAHGVLMERVAGTRVPVRALER